MPDAYSMKCQEERAALNRPLVAVVDDDHSVRESLPDLLWELGFAARVFPSAEEFLSSDSVGKTSCLILDMVMPGMTGLDLQRELKARGQGIPVVFITAQKDEAVRARALEQGAAGYLLKPFSDTALLAALKRALRVN
jgi:FixJ family two-component response regulator